ncbi:CPBP family intramembrane glutamic endopeptidase [Priestia megaterium]|uniref:CPBP family intramembrane glutamic endopeptidase n=1 Tax=Priestia megaterium TaxID=1404 RepID=UPI001145B18B|nr:CPBP family intramembrane glutamic endopeptidase [Priestia megaterium]
MFLGMFPLTIIIIKESQRFVSTQYAYNLLVQFTILFVTLILINKDLFLYLEIPENSITKTLTLSISICFSALMLKGIGLLIVGTKNPQGLAGTTLGKQEYLDSLTILPIIGIGEELLKLVIFLGLFSLIPGNKLVRFYGALLLVSFFFGFLHSFGYPITAVIPIFLGAIPTIFVTIYYKSVIPAILEHIFWDGFSFTYHYNNNSIAYVMMILMLLFFIKIFKDKNRSKHYTK